MILKTEKAMSDRFRVLNMKKHFLERVDVEKCLVRLYGENEAPLGGCCGYERGGVFGGGGLLERSEASAG